MARVDNARRLRQEQTAAERKLWSILRGRRLDGFKFRRQVPIDRYFVDFACFEARLIVELDGRQHADRVEYDERRTQLLDSLGWRVIRFWNTPVLTETQGVIDAILAELRLSRP